MDKLDFIILVISLISLYYTIRMANGLLEAKAELAAFKEKLSGSAIGGVLGL